MRTALASALLAALLWAAAASHVCDSGWERLYDATPDGQRYADRNTNKMVDRILGSVIEGTGCDLIRAWKQEACYSSQAAVGGKQLQGQYGFGAEVEVLCPGEARPTYWEVLVMATAQRSGAFQVTWSDITPYPQ